MAKSQFANLHGATNSHIYDHTGKRVQGSIHPKHVFVLDTSPTSYHNLSTMDKAYVDRIRYPAKVPLRVHRRRARARKQKARNAVAVMNLEAEKKRTKYQNSFNFSVYIKDNRKLRKAHQAHQARSPRVFTKARKEQQSRELHKALDARKARKAYPFGQASIYVKSNGIISSIDPVTFMNSSDADLRKLGVSPAAIDFRNLHAKTASGGNRNRAVTNATMPGSWVSASAPAPAEGSSSPVQSGPAFPIGNIGPIGEDDDDEDQAAQFPPPPRQLVECFVRHASLTRLPSAGFEVCKRWKDNGVLSNVPECIHVSNLLDILQHKPEMGFNLSRLSPILVEFLKRIGIENAASAQTKHIKPKFLDNGDAPRMNFVTVFTSAGEVLPEDYHSATDFYRERLSIEDLVDTTGLTSNQMDFLTAAYLEVIRSEEEPNRQEFISDDEAQSLDLDALLASAQPLPDSDAETDDDDDKDKNAMVGHDGIFDYLREVVDVKTGESVEPDTKVAKLYRVERFDKTLSGLFFRSRELPAAWFSSESQMPKIDFASGEQLNTVGLSMKVSIVEALTAPAIEIRIMYMNEATDTQPLASAYFHIPFTGNTRTGETKALENFKNSHHAETYAYVFEWNFLCKGAYIHRGLVGLLAHEAKFSDDDKALLNFVMNMTRDDYEPAHVTIKQFQPPPPVKHTPATHEQWQNMTKDERAAEKAASKLPAPRAPDALAEMDKHVSEVYSHLPNNPEGKCTPKSFEEYPYSAYRALSNFITVKSNGMPSPHTLFRKYFAKLPAPMIPFKPTSTFRSIDEYRMKMSQATEGEFRETALQLELFCDPEPLLSFDAETPDEENPHKMRLWTFGSIVVAAIKISDFQQINPLAEIPMRISAGTKVALEWASRKSESVQKASGHVFTPSFFLPHCDLAVLLTDRTAESLGNHTAGNADADGEASNAEAEADADGEASNAETAKDAQATDTKSDKQSGGMGKEYKDMSSMTREQRTKFCRSPYAVKLTIKPNEVVYKQQMLTVNTLTSDANKKWHPYLLNQQPFTTALEEVDFTARSFGDDVEKSSWEAKVDAAYKKALEFKPADVSDFAWNDEQLDVLQSMRKNAGMIKFVTGPAATGKTTLQQAIMSFYYDIGFHVIYDAPANTNVADFMTRFNRDNPTTPIVCVAPRSAESSLTADCRDEGMDEPTIGQFKNQVIFDILQEQMKSKDVKQKYAGSHKFHVRKMVLTTATEGTRVDMTCLDAVENNNDVTGNLNEDGQWREGDLGSDEETDVIDMHNSRNGAGQNLADDSEDEDDDEFGLRTITLEQAQELPDHATKAPLPEGYVCKRYLPEGADPDDRSAGYPVYIDIANRIVSRIHPSKVDSRKVEFNLWQKLGEFIKRVKDEDISDWIDPETGFKDEQAIKDFKTLYNRACKIIIGTSKIICCTSAVATGKLVRNTFASGKYEAHPIGVIVIKEEAAKDNEPNFFGPIVNCSYYKRVAGVFAFGDHLQLQPTVTGSSGSFSINHAPQQLLNSFFSRSIAEGMPHTLLCKQGRMHDFIAAIPNQYVYAGKLETATQRKRTLEEDIPNCNVVEKLRELFRSVGAERVDDRTEENLRVQGFQVAGPVLKNPKTGSRVNLQQINFVAEKIVPAMQAVYGTQTRKKCMIVIGYAEGVDRMNEALLKMRSLHANMTSNMMPIVQTIDSAQGAQADWVCFVATINEAEKPSDLGFQKDDKRINVALTRAVNIQTMVYGSLTGNLYENTNLDVKPVDTTGRNTLQSPLLLVMAKVLKKNDLSTTYEQKEVTEADCPKHLLGLGEDDEVESTGGTKEDAAPASEDGNGNAGGAAPAPAPGGWDDSGNAGGAAPAPAPGGWEDSGDAGGVPLAPGNAAW